MILLRRKTGETARAGDHAASARHSARRWRRCGTVPRRPANHAGDRRRRIRPVRLFTSAQPRPGREPARAREHARMIRRATAWSWCSTRSKPCRSALAGAASPSSAGRPIEPPLAAGAPRCPIEAARAGRSRMPFVGSLALFNARGKVVNLRRASMAGAGDRRHGPRFLQGVANDPHVGRLSAPVRNRASGTWTIRALDRKPNGERAISA